MRMENKQTLYFILFGTALVLVSCCAQTTKPNIVIWMNDDIGYGNFSFGGGSINTPRLARTGRQGISYTRAWSNPICRPTRAILMTGKYATETGWWGQGHPLPTSLGQEFGTFAHVAKAQGYRTLMVGKWQLTTDTTTDHGFDSYCLWEKSDLRSVARLRQDFVELADGPVYTSEERNGAGVQNRYWHPLVVRHLWPSEHEMLITNTTVSADNFGPTVFLQCIHDFIKVNKSTPFFIYFAGVTAHQHWEDIVGRQTFIGMPIVEGREVMDFTTREPEGAGSLESNVDFVDRMIGYLRGIIRAEGHYKNTILVFTGDNGTHGYGKGSTTSEQGTHVPLLVWGGPVKKRGKVKHLISLVDVYNTVSELMGAGVDASRPNSYSWAKFWTGESNSFIRKWMVAYRGELDSNGVIKPKWVVRNRQFIRDGENRLWDCREGRDERDCNEVNPSDFQNTYDRLGSKVDEIKRSGYSDATLFWRKCR